MKKHHENMRRTVIIAAAAAGGLASASAQSTSGLTLYGRLNTGLEQVSVQGGHQLTRLSNYRSVLGFRGEEDLGAGLKAVWQLEGSLALDSGAGSSFTNRDTRIGLAGAWGTAFAGVWTLPYTSATASFDPFYPTTAGYMALMGNGSASVSNHVQDTSAFDRRQVNQFQYWSPTMAGLSVRLAYAVNEDTAGSGARPWLASGSITYEAGGWLLTAAMERHEQYQAKGTADVGAKVGASYQWGAARLAAVAERLAYETTSGTLERNAWHLSATYRLGPGMFKAGYAHAADGRGTSTARIGFIQRGADTGASQATLGYDHALSQRTTLQAFYGLIDNQRRAAYDFAINPAGMERGQRAAVFSLGLRHNF